MNKKITSMISLILVTSIIFTGCGKNKEQLVNKLETKIEQTQEETSTKEQIDIASIKNKYGSIDDKAIKPFYNVEQNTQFTFHFNSKVEPVYAVTVHTDKKCDENSIVYQINDGYITENGVDVVVKPGKPVLNTSDRVSGELENYNWGNAPIYYLCIRYDMDATQPTLLNDPIIIPFTIKNKISTPNLSCKINDDGAFSLVWQPVEGAVSYNIYEANRVKDISEAVNLTRAEAGYVGDHLNLLTTVKSSITSFNDFNNDNTENTIKDTNGYIYNQNFYDLGNYYVTAIDVEGNESFFSMPIEGWLYDNQLPKTFDEYNTFVKNDASNITYLPESVPVTMCDNTIAYMPINYTKISDIKYPGQDYESVSYKYEIIGTKLEGEINYYNSNGNYQDVILSSYKPNGDLYIIDTDIEKIPNIKVDTINDNNYSNSKISLDKTVSYPTENKIKYNNDVLYKRADMENARIVLDGVYSSSFFSIDTYIDDERYMVEQTINEPEKPINTNKPNNDTSSTKDSTTTQENQINENSSQNSLSNLVNNSSNVDENSVTPSSEEPSTNNVTVVNEQNIELYNTETPSNDREEIENEPNTQGDTSNNDINIPEEITSDNLVDSQIDSTNQQVEEGNKEKIETTIYKVFADSAEEEYLATQMINVETTISLKAFPKLQDMEYLIDVLYKIVYQNPYIISWESASYDYLNQALVVTYSFDKETIQSKQAEIEKEAKNIVNSIITSSMSDEEKVNAIWLYLEQNTKYDDAALEAAEANNFQDTTGFEDAFNTYGILCNKVGVCQSYAYTYTLLCDMAGVECRMLTGYLNKTLPHAWNIVKIDGNWYWLDATNNENVTGIPYFVFDTSYEFASSIDYVLDDSYDLNTALSFAYTTDNSKDYYYKNNLYAETPNDVITKIVENYNNDKDTIAIKTKSFEITEDFIQNLAVSLYQAGVTEEEINNIRFGFYSGYFIIIKS